MSHPAMSDKGALRKNPIQDRAHEGKCTCFGFSSSGTEQTKPWVRQVYLIKELFTFKTMRSRAVKLTLKERGERLSINFYSRCSGKRSSSFGLIVLFDGFTDGEKVFCLH